jgi:ribosome-associated protein
LEAQPTIRLDQFLKWQGLVGTGGQAKYLIQEGQVQVNGQVETRRTRKLAPGDIVTIEGQSVTVNLDQATPDY